jgi:hypothetical protein
LLTPNSKLPGVAASGMYCTNRNTRVHQAIDIAGCICQLLCGPSCRQQSNIDLP